MPVCNLMSCDLRVCCSEVCEWALSLLTQAELDLEKGLEMRKRVLSGILASEETYLSHLEALLLVREIQVWIWQQCALEFAQGVLQGVLLVRCMG